MRREPFFQDERGGNRVDGGLPAPKAPLFREPLARFKAGETLVRVIYRQAEMRGESLAEAPRCPSRRALAAIHVQRKPYHKVYDTALFDLIGYLLHIANIRTPLYGAQRVGRRSLILRYR